MRKACLRAGVMAAALTAGALALCGTAAFAAKGDVGCQPGSGKQLAGQHLTDTQVTEFQPGELRCANLAGAHLAGLSLAQVDFTGATLKNADLEHADLTQATLDEADLSGANLTDATLDQAELQGANLSGANLSGASLTQADLTGANVTKAKLSGTSFDQTTTDQANFEGATGVAPWYLFVGIAALLFFSILAAVSVRRALRSSSRNAAFRLLRGLVGSLVVAIGFNLTVGGFLGNVLSASGPPVAQTCQAGVLCTVGVASGFIGIFGGVVVMIVGFVLRSTRSRGGEPALSGQGWSGQF